VLASPFELRILKQGNYRSLFTKERLSFEVYLTPRLGGRVLHLVSILTKYPLKNSSFF